MLRLAGVGERALLSLNPAVRPPLVLAAATPRLLLPEPSAHRFERAISEHIGRTASWSVVTLSRTLHLESLASTHAASPAALREANQIPRGSQPMAGSVLLLPVPPHAGARTDDAVVATAHVNLAPDTVRVTTSAQPSPPHSIAPRYRSPALGCLRRHPYSQESLPTRRDISNVQRTTTPSGRRNSPYPWGFMFATAPV